MWTNIKSLFSAENLSAEPKLPHDFDRQVRQAISLVGNSSDFNTDEEFLNHLTNNGIEYVAAVEILLFMPIAFVRQLLFTANWHDSYIEYIDEKRKVEKKYSETKSFQIISKVTTQYFQSEPDKETVFKIGRRSAEFNVINPLLLANPDLKLEEIQLSQTVIIR